MRLQRRIRLGMSAAPNSAVNTAVSLEFRYFGMWNRPASSLSQQNSEGQAFDEKAKPRLGVITVLPSICR